MRFVDTNVLLYRVSMVEAEAAKHRIASELLEATDLRLSVQVLQEFYVQATRSSRDGALSHDEAAGLVRSWNRFQPISITPEILDAALIARERWGISYWDAAIIEAARSVGCETVLSEDLNDGQDYGGVRVVNPFRVKQNPERSSCQRDDINFAGRTPVRTS
jgi:predicted nucleic acid-binding protein